MEELKVGIIELDLIIELKGSSFEVRVMKGLGLLFVDNHILVRVIVNMHL